MTFLVDTNVLLRSVEPDYSVKGVQVHDAKLVAAMCVHDLTHILTFNVDDFSRYPEIIAVHPSTVRC